MAEIGADQLLVRFGDRGVIKLKRRRDGGIARAEHVARLPVPHLEIAQHQLELGALLAAVRAVQLLAAGEDGDDRRLAGHRLRCDCAGPVAMSPQA